MTLVAMALTAAIAGCAKQAPSSQALHPVHAVEPTRPKLALGRVAASSESDALHKELAQHLTELQKCQGANTNGAASVWFRIEPDGTVAEAMGRGDDDVMASCLADAVRGIHFAQGTSLSGHVTFAIQSP
ncbi:MAG: hypothetical protein KF773_34945 [Deltaproteobacteria bacterium]|nr:hypothetical protein [Deltaproteobacteria bacterium]